MDTLITVIIPVRNGAAFIEKAISSVLGQTINSYKIIVSDNGSTDSTPLILSKYADDPRIQTIRQTGRLDMFEHFNKCLEMVETKYFMMLHHDDFLYGTSALEHAYSALEEFPSIAAVYSDMVYADKVGRTINHRQFRRANIVKADTVARQSVMSMRNLFGIPILVRSESVEHHRYDNRLTYSADLDFSIALSKHGEIYHIQKHLIAYRIHGTNASVSLFRLALDQMEQIATKHDISMNVIGRTKMYLSACLVLIQKWIYFQYLEKVRKY